MLNLLFEEVTQPSSSKAPKVTGQAPNDGSQTQAPKVTSKALIAIHQTPKLSERRREIYYRITTKFPTTAWNLSYMPQAEEFRSLLFHSLGFDTVPPPDSGNTGSASSSTGPVASSSRHRPTERATPSPVTQVAQPPTQSTGRPPQSTGKPPQIIGEPAPQPRSDSPRVWSRLIGRLTHPTEMATSSSVSRVAPPSPSSAGIPLLLPQSVGVLNITLKSRKAVRTSSPQSTSPPFWRYRP